MYHKLSTYWLHSVLLQDARSKRTPFDSRSNTSTAYARRLFRNDIEIPYSFDHNKIQTSSDSVLGEIPSPNFDFFLGFEGKKP